MTLLPNYLPNTFNIHVTAEITEDNERKEENTNMQSIVFGYGVKDGSCGKSFGIHVAQICAFPKIVIEIAQMKAAQLEHQ